MAAVAEKSQQHAPANGVGRLSRLGFERLAQCLLVVPKEYRDCTSQVTRLDHSQIGQTLYFGLLITSVTAFDKFKNRTSNPRFAFRVQIGVVDEAGTQARITVFGDVWTWLKKAPGEWISIYGTMDVWNNELQINNPELVAPENHGRIIPVYKGKPGQVSGESIQECVGRALPEIEEAGCHLLAGLGMREDEFVAETRVKTPTILLRAIHEPRSVDQGLRAINLAKRLTALAIVRQAAANQVKKVVARSSIPITKTAVQELIGTLPYSLTKDQATSIDEIVDDLRSPYPMRRLLSGDVGTGKSLTFFVPAVAAWKAGARVAIIVPSQLLVSQQARELQTFFPGVPVSEVVAGGSIGEGIAIGTTAMLNAAARKKITFDLAICDEQHKFSVAQKTALLKGHTNFLEATATVIPRTLAIVNYGGMDLSILRECPVKKEITSRVVFGHERERVYNFIERVFEAGSQVAVIMPLVEEGGKKELGLESVAQAQEELSRVFPHRRIGVLTGRMQAEEKQAVIDAMHNHTIDLLVSTVVIETGVTLPSLRALVVFNAERFGASQLHQLRGRVARKGGKGYFFMFCPNEVEEEALERLSLLTKYNDGFSLAEADMDLRGFGNMEEDADSQTGASRLLFWGVKLTKKEIEEQVAQITP